MQNEFWRFCMIWLLRPRGASSIYLRFQRAAAVASPFVMAWSELYKAPLTLPWNELSWRKITTMMLASNLGVWLVLLRILNIYFQEWCTLAGIKSAHVLGYRPRLFLSWKLSVGTPRVFREAGRHHRSVGQHCVFWINVSLGKVRSVTATSSGIAFIWISYWQHAGVGCPVLSATSVCQDENVMAWGFSTAFLTLLPCRKYLEQSVVLQWTRKEARRTGKWERKELPNTLSKTAVSVGVPSFSIRSVPKSAVTTAKLLFPAWFLYAIFCQKEAT